MRKSIAMTLLVLVSSNAAAEWLKVGTSAIAASYADQETIRRAGTLVKMWGLLDFTVAQQSPASREKHYLSEKTQVEFDCRKERARMLSYTLHSENMGRGNVVHSSSKPEKWESVPLGSAMAAARRFACRDR